MELFRLLGQIIQARLKFGLDPEVFVVCCSVVLTPWTIARQAHSVHRISQDISFSRDLPNQVFPAIAGRFFTI